MPRRQKQLPTPSRIHDAHIVLNASDNEAIRQVAVRRNINPLALESGARIIKQTLIPNRKL